MLHETMNPDVTDRIQRITTRLVAENPAGRGLCLIGGYRFRLLDHSPRRSVDIDYHWNGDLDAKAVSLTELFERKLFPEVKRSLGYDGRAHPGGGPGDESSFVKIIELAFFRLDAPVPRIEIPVEITAILCADPPNVRTLPGTVYLTVSDQDMVESKVIAILNRTYVRERDFLDLFLFQEHLAPDTERRMAGKLAACHLMADDIARRIEAFRRDRDYHVRNIEAVIRGQVEPETAERLMTGGGGGVVFDQVMGILSRTLNLKRDSVQ